MNIRSITVNTILVISVFLVFASTIFFNTAKADDSLGDLIAQIEQPAAVPEYDAPVLPSTAMQSEVFLVGGRTQVGQASYYGRNHHGRRTASGERFNMWAMTAAHKSLPFGTCLAVVNPKTNQSAIVRINDRGPYHGNRVLDLSQGVATKIGMIKSGTAKIQYQKVSCPTAMRIKYV